ncbi:hypothetical protein HBH53_051820 [Parastagonospora nodorum]|nr:hypothetical protein HBH53_051820 [Parastagonospora nodorum]KAH4202124.1 hypothetical protein HBH42_014040 [Parastagonospora nodorum]KAH5081111.1 hypothetical protein HBH95_071640 [Parastagonospora nodorum]KAH5415256.1 hypothetical protein HBI32_116890 [Parastagonospora nodorum]
MSFEVNNTIYNNFLRIRLPCPPLKIIMSQNWVQRLSEHCTVRGFSNPSYQTVSDRRGGRTAWSSIACINGVTYPAKFWYDGEYVEQSKHDAAESALRILTGTQDMTTEPPPATFYQQRASA